MANLYEVTRADFTAAKAAFDSGDFQQMNVYSNRLMSNVLFGEDNLYVLPGFFMKNIAIEFIRVGGDSTIGRELRPKAQAFISKLKDAFKEQIDLTAIWESYFEYDKATRKLHMTEVERKAYKENAAFTDEALDYLLREFLFDGNSLFLENNLVLKGILIEADRLVRNHGVGSKHSVMVCLLIALDRFYEYARMECTSPREGLNRQALEQILTPFIDGLKRFHEEKSQAPFEAATELLCKIILDWRRCFIRYMELGKPSMAEEGKIKLPIEARKKIGETIAQALQKDLNSKGRKDRK
jgi:hypothetical protein